MTSPNSKRSCRLERSKKSVGWRLPETRWSSASRRTRCFSGSTARGRRRAHRGAIEVRRAAAEEFRTRSFAAETAGRPPHVGDGASQLAATPALRRGEVTVWARRRMWARPARRFDPLRRRSARNRVQRRLLRDGIESAEGDEMRLRLIDPLRPGLIQGRRGLLMPDLADPSRRLIVETVFLANFRPRGWSSRSSQARAQWAPTAQARQTCWRPFRRHPVAADAIRRGADPVRRVGSRIRLEGAGDGRGAISVALSTAEESRPVDGARGRQSNFAGDSDARLHARPTGDRQGRPGRAARVLRPLAEPSACAVEPASSSAAAQLWNAALKFGDRTTIAPGPQLADLARPWWRRESSCSNCWPGRCRVCRLLELPGARPRTRHRLTQGELEARLEHDLGRGSRPAQAHISTTSRSWPPTATFVLSAPRGSNGQPCSLLLARRSWPSAETILRCRSHDDVLSNSIHSAAACWRPGRRWRSDADHRDHRGRVAGRTGAATRGVAGGGGGPLERWTGSTARSERCCRASGRRRACPRCSSPGPRRSGRWWPQTPGPPGSRETGRCT